MGDETTVTATEAGRLIGIHRTEVSRRARPGGVLEDAVVEEAKGRRGARFSRRAIKVYAAVMREQRPLDPQHERSRRDAAAADLAELRLAVEKGKFLEVEDVRLTWAAEFTAIRNRLLAFASRLSLTLGVDAAVIEGEVHMVLTELSDPESAGKVKPATKKATRRKVQKKAPRKKAAKRRRNKAA